MIGQTVSHYRITEKLGEGGMGVVYRAEDTHLHCSRALKFLPTTVTPDSPEHVRLVNEARALAALEHNNICPVQEIGEHNGQTFIVMSYLEGRTLKDRMAEGPILLDEALEIARQISAGLAAAHAKGIVHRDVKPDNVMLTQAGGDTQGRPRAVLMDFGIAKNIDTTLVTRTGTVMGTAAYMSPEQARGEIVEAASDVWAVGVLLYEMLAGRRPFQGAVEPALLYAIVNKDPEPLAGSDQEVPESVERVIGKALAKDRGNRYADAGELLVDLERAIVGEEVKGRRLARRRKWPIVGTASALIGLVIVSLFIWPGFLVSNSAITALAVLPFENLSGTASQDYYADGMTDALISQIGQISALNVISRTSVMRYKQSNKALPEIARELKVDAVVEASVLRDRDMVRVSARLIRTNPERQIWAESYTRNADDIISLYSELARAIADRVEVVVTEQERERIERVQSIDSRAHDAYLKGKYFYWKGTEKDLEQCIADFRAAIDIEPTYAQAYAWLSMAYRRSVHFGYMSPKDGEPKAVAAAQRAMELDDTLADVQVANLNYERALEINPNNLAAVSALMGSYVRAGRFDEGIEAAKRAIDIDPLSVYVSMQLGWANFMALRYDDAISALLKTIEIDRTYAFAWEELAWAYAGKGLAREARAAADTAIALTPPPIEDEITLGGLGRVYAESGRSDKAREFLNKLIELRSVKHVDAYYIAEIYAGLGIVDSVFFWLDRADAENSPSLRGMRFEPWLVPLRQDPRFRDLVRKESVPGE